MLQLQFPFSLGVDGFLRDYWQRRPLLMRAALPGYRSPLAADELAGLSCEDDVESRLVIEHGATPWEVRYGPFTDEEYAQLPTDHWTLLVQDVDKHVPDAARLLDAFSFIPRWRVDDVMISFAADQGSVGPHTDAYDVFLVQAEGKRRWRISTRPYGPEDLLPDIDLKVLKRFDTEQEWLLEPGDVLYLPPGVAHWGIAEGECITCSVGFRAPSEQELLADWCDHLIALSDPEQHYSDPPLSPEQPGGEITTAAVARVSTMIERSLQQKESERARWFGRYVTVPKPHLPVVPPDDYVDEDAFVQLLETQGPLLINPHSRLAYTQTDDGLYLFADGEDFPISAGLKSPLQALTERIGNEEVESDAWVRTREGCRLLCALYNQGTLLLEDDDE